MERVRDPAIEHWDRALKGKMKGAMATQVNEMFAELEEDRRELLELMVSRIVDTTLHHLLWTLEQVPWVHLGIDSEKNSIPDIRDIELGDLQGYLYDWIPRFSKERYTPPA